MIDVVQRLLELVQSGKPAVYCSVVETRGSTPQKPGAALLVLPAGGQVGTLGGGCVEAEVRRRALAMLHAESCEAQLLQFHLDNDYGWDDGLLCGGRMTVLAEHIQRPEQHSYFQRLLELLRSGRGHTEAVALERADLQGAEPGARWLFDRSGRCVAALRGDGATTNVGARLQPLNARPRPYTQGGVAYTPYPPRCRLLLVGAGHVAKAVARLAAETDFDVWVLDDRAEYASADRFPDASRILVGDIPQRLRELEIDEHTYVVIVTRGHLHDEAALHAVIDRPAGYIGMIGSRRKVRLIFEDLVAAGVDPEALAQVHAPIGLDIGSQTVPEIAVSIVAELIACRNQVAARARPTPKLSQKVQSTA